MKPLCIDLFCGLGGWTEGFLAEGYDVVGFDIVRRPYPAQLVLQDVLTLHGSQFRNAAVIVASPPCQAYSYRAMPWNPLWETNSRMDDDGAPPVNHRIPDTIHNGLFWACMRIAQEAGVPVIIENVKGAQPWVGRARWHYGSFYLWGDVPALMPHTFGGRMKFPAHCGPRLWKDRTVPRLNDGEHSHAFHMAGVKSAQDGLGGYGDSFGWNNTPMRRGNSKSEGRKAASAQIAKIPFPLAQHIARCFKPDGERPGRAGSQTQGLVAEVPRTFTS